ncbi:hypothetical protein FOXYSP1_17029 [Fusarium oxysporum f. sp. phaseoli]
MIPKIASSCNPITVHPWEKPLQEKTPRRLERCSMDEAVASFHGLQAAAEAAKKKRFSGQYTTAEIGHAASELQKGQRAIWGPCVEIRGHQGAQEVEQLAATGVVRAAKAAEVGRGSAKLQVSVRVTVRRPSMSSSRMLRMSSGQPKLQRSVVREVEGHRGRNVAGSRSRNVEV